jgi:hypothetical protein
VNRHHFLVLPAAVFALATGTLPAAAANPPIANNPASDASEADLLFAKEPTGAPRPTPRLADGHPDFTGFWKTLRVPAKPIGNLGRDEPGYELPFTPEGKKAQEFNRTRTIDPEALCILGGIPRHNASALPFEVVANPKRVVFLYLYTTYRIVPLDGRAHTEDPDPKYFGDEIGSWDGDTLVIDSIGFKDSKDGKLWIDENGDPQSSDTHVIERWTRTDADHLHLDMTVIDPKYYTRPIHYGRTWILGPAGQDESEYACSENNVDASHLGPGPGPIGPDGNRGYSVPNLPENPPGPEAYEKH